MLLLLLVLFLLPNGQSRAANGKGSPCGDTWVCQVVIALWEITQATTCTTKKRSRLITNRNVRSKAPFANAPPPLGRCRHTPGQRDAGRLLPCALPRESVSGNFSRRHVLGALTRPQDGRGYVAIPPHPWDPKMVGVMSPFLPTLGTPRW